MGGFLSLISKKAGGVLTTRVFVIAIIALMGSTSAYFLAHRHVNKLYLEALVDIETKDQLIDEYEIDIITLANQIDFAEESCNNSIKNVGNYQTKLGNAKTELSSLYEINNQCEIDLAYYIAETNRITQEVLDDPDNACSVVFINSEDNPDENDTARYLDSYIPDDIILLHVQGEGKGTSVPEIHTP